jgi:hypothetical protein
MNMYDRSMRDQTRSKVSFSRGLLKYVDEEPVVGREGGATGPEQGGPSGPAPVYAAGPVDTGGAGLTPIYASTPREGNPWRNSQEEWERMQAERVESRERRYQDEIEWQSVRIRHLELLLDGERKMVDTLSQFANMP